MATENKKYIPALRFPEFQNDGEWNYEYGNMLYDSIVNKKHKSDLPILAITQDNGAIPRDEINYRVIVNDKSIEGYKIVEIGDFIISLRSFQGGIEYSRYKGLCSPAYIVLRKKHSKICDDFYRHYFKSFQYIQALNRNLEGIRDGKMVSYKQFSDIKLPCPSLAEQKKIADCLSSLDKYIDATKRKLELLKEHKKGLMQRLFPAEGKTTPELRFPEFQNDGEWRRCTTNEIFSRITRKNTINNQNVLTISAQYGLISQYEYFNKNVAAADVSNYYLIDKHDFAYNKSRSLGYPYGAIKPLKMYDQGVVSPLYICFRIKDDVQCSNTFFEYYFESELIHKEIQNMAQEGARNHGLLNISTEDFFNKIQLYIPSFVEQKKIADCLSSLEDIIMFYEDEILELELHRKGLMQQLFPKL